jgi:hypothetical protein
MIVNKLIRLLCSLSTSTLICGASIANPLISLVPEVAKIHPPQNLFVDVVISGLQSGDTNALLGAFDLTVLFDPNVVTLLTIGSTLGTGLGDPANPLETLVGGDASAPGRFEFFEVSLLEASPTTCTFCIGPYLQDLQSDSFTLASLLFYSPEAPAGTLFTNFILPADAVVLSDAAGNAITDFRIANASVNIPEPAGGVLIATAMFALLVTRKKRLAR